jgi:hypothetical protein
MKLLVALLSLFLPWPLRRAVLRGLLGYQIAPGARIGLSLVYPRRLVLGEGARIGHLTVCKGIDLLDLGAEARIGNLNWITGYPSGAPGHFAHQPDRRPELVLGPHAAITHRHIVDCTAPVHLGPFATCGGFRSQLLTHRVNLELSRQEAYPITLGAYGFVGTGCILLGGAALPDYAVLGAGSLLNQAFTEKYQLYAGVPARPVKPLPETLGYFQRKTGYVI